MTRQDYERIFRTFPDVVTIMELRVMLGGIGDTYARKLLRSNLVEYFYIRGTYYIPKAKVIDYLLSPHYLQTLTRFRRGKK